MQKGFFILIFLAVLFEVIADVFFKYWSVNLKSIFLLVGMVLYSIGTVIWAISLKYEDLSRAITIFTVINLIVVVSVGVLFFNEDLSLINKIGIALGVISVLLIQM